MHFALPISRPLWRHISQLNPFSHRHLIPYFHLPSAWQALLIVLLLTVLCPLTQAYLIFANLKEIRKLDENHVNPRGRSNTTVILDRLEETVAIDFDFEEKIIFWSDVGYEAISGLKLSDSRTFDVISNHGIISPDGIAVDWVTKKLYWVDSETNRIEVALYNGSYRTVLFWQNLDQPRAIVLVPSEGLMFWSDWGYIPKIECASMDGNNSTRKVIVSEHIHWPNGLTVDYEAKRLYWVDAKMDEIASASYDGTNRQTVSCGSLLHPYALTIHGQLLYWTDIQTKDVHSCNMTSQTSKRAYIVQSKNHELKPTGIAIFDASRQPQSPSPCLINNGNCSHLCMLSSEPPYYTCACPTGIKLMNDGKTCPASPDTILLLARRSDIRRISLDTNDYTSVVLPIRGIKHINVLDYDPVEGKIYWADDELRVIKRAMLNGTNAETIISTEVHHPDGIAIDWINRNFYWTDAGTDRIEVARLNGSSRTILLNEGLDKPRAIVLHPEEGLLFWSDWGIVPKIERAALDGSQRMTIVDKSIVWPNGLSIDYELSRIYWCDAKLDTIEVAKFDGSGRVKILTDTNSHFFGFTVFNSWIYWSDWQRRSVERIHKLTGEGRETIVEQLPDLMGIKAVWVKNQANLHHVSVNPCANNGNCSHLCLKRGRHDFGCVCPTGYELTTDNRTCVISKAYFLLLRKNDIRSLTLESKQFDVMQVSGIHSATAFDVNVAANTVYWIDSHKKNILRSFINGSKTEIVVQMSLEAPQSLAIDWISNNLYFTDTAMKRIEVVRFDGSFRKVLYYDPKRSPHSLVVDPIVGYLFWSDWSETGTIERSFLDGESRQTITKTVGHASSLTLDYAEKRLFWVEVTANGGQNQIVSCLYNGHSKNILPIEDLSKPTSMVIFGDLIYLLDATQQAIKSVNKSQAEDRGVVKTSSDLASASDLFMHHSLSQKGWNFCAVNNGSCHHLCFARASRPKSSIADLVYCSCATHYKLADDGRKCLEPESFLLFSHKNEITRFLFDQSNDFKDVTISLSHTKQVKALAYDQVDFCIYWIDGKNQSIRRVRLNGTAMEVVIETSYNELVDLVIDPYSRMLFWTSSRTNSINATRLIGHPTPIGAIYQSSNDNPRLLTYHNQKNLLFWTNEMQSPQIERISMPSGLKTTVVSERLNDILAITVDQELDYLLWADKSSNMIEYSDLEGRRRITLYTEANIHPISMTAYSKYLFWVEKDKKTIEKVPLDLNNGRNKQTIFGKISSITDIIAVPSMVRNSSKQNCVEENGGCSHLCTIIRNGNSTEFQSKCGCPKGLVLSRDEKNCVDPIRCEKKQFSCKNGISCIDAIFRCNGFADCLDGSDELNCPKCDSNQFTCLKDVISHEELICLDNARVCDGQKDCYLGHDELCCADKFRCNSRHCLTSDQLCDSKKDCIDGEDEDISICRLYPNKVTVEPARNSLSLFLIIAFVTVFVIFMVLQCKRCVKVGQEKKEMPDGFLMTEQNSIGGARNNRNPHRSKFNKKSLLNDKHGRQENCNTLTSTTTVSGLDTPNEASHVPGTESHLLQHTIQTAPLIETNMGASSSDSSAPVAYPCETINPPPSPATERSQSAYSSYSSSLFVPRARSRSKNGGVFSSGNPNNSSGRRHKKSRWPKSSLRGPPPTPCGTDVYDELEPSSVKYTFYDNAHAEMDDFDYHPPPPTPRHYFSDPSCPPSPVTEHSFCNLNLNPPPPSPVQEYAD